MVKALYKNDTGKIVSRVTFNILGKDGSVINNFSEPASLDPGEADTFKSRIQHSRFPSSTKLWEEPYAQEKKKYADVSKCQIVNIETEN